MSYDIFFIKGKKVKLEEIEDILEMDAEEGDSIYISKTLMNDIKDLLYSKGFNFSEFVNENYLELTSSDIQIQIFTNQICISVPYSVSVENIHSEVKKIAELFISIGFTGYDPQISKIIDNNFDFSQSYSKLQSKMSTKVLIDNYKFSFWDIYGRYIIGVIWVIFCLSLVIILNSIK